MTGHVEASNADRAYDTARGSELLTFACLPTLTLHASWQQAVLTPAHWQLMHRLASDAQALAQWHRVCSGLLIAQQCLTAPDADSLVSVVGDWALASPEALGELTLDLGAAVCAKDLNTVIAGDALRALAERLTPTRFDWARQQLGELPGPAPLRAAYASLDQHLARIRHYGLAVLARLWETLPIACGQRARLKCPRLTPSLPGWAPHDAVQWLESLGLVRPQTNADSVLQHAASSRAALEGAAA